MPDAASAPLPSWLAVLGPRPPGTPGSTVVYAPTMASTHAHALTLADAGAAPGTLVTTDHQTEGRGRHGRAWHDAPGASLLLSLLLVPAPPPEVAARATLAAALALVDALAAAGLDARLKWPNDVRLGGRKVAGLLATRTREAVVLSAGLNVNGTDFPPELAAIATSMAREAGHPFERGPVLAAYLDALGPLLELAAHAPGALLARYRARLEGLGTPVELRAHDGAPPLTGLFESVTDTGGLVLRLASGEAATFHAGDVSLRPAAPEVR